MINKFWNYATRSSIISFVFLLIGLLLNPIFLILVILIYSIGLLARNIKSLEDSFLGKIKKETLIKLTLLFSGTLLAFDVSGGGLVCLIFSIIPIIWVALTDKRIFNKSAEETSNKIDKEIQVKKLKKEEQEGKELKLIKESSQVEVNEIRNNNEKNADGERENRIQELRSGDLLFEESEYEERSDREIVLAAISYNGNAFGLASKELKDEYELVVEAMKNNANAFIYASERLRTMDEIKEKSNQYEYPEDGVNEQLYNMNKIVWDRGYYAETEVGTWYEVYVTETIKKIYKTERDALEALYNFYELDLSMYEEYNQINFFVPNYESTLTADEMTDILI